MRKELRRLSLAILAISMSASTMAQCPQLYDFYGDPSDAPIWYHCTSNDYTLSIQSPDNIGTWSVDWGDGSPVENGSSLVPPQSITHLYSATVNTYTVTFTETSSGCVVQGTLVMEEATSASIQIPVGGLTQACAPQAMEFINSSTNTSDNTIFTWDFGDGSPQEVYDHTNLGQTISHTYQENTVDCETVVTLTAENYCNTVQGGPSAATFNPIRIWDYDDAAITPSAYVLCWPDNTVDYLNTSEMNCFMQGNIAQRYEYWNFGDYWGLGHDSIVPWTPWPPTFPHTISYPAIGTYNVTLLDSNFCGIDAVTIAIDIVPPPAAGVSISADSICQGESVTIFNNSSAEANAWLVNYGEGAGWQWMGAGTASHTYNSPGSYDIGLVAYVSGAGAACTDTAWTDVYVRPSPLADFSLSDDEACDQLDYTVTNTSVNAVLWNWDMGNGNSYLIEDPPDQSYTTPGDHDVYLYVESVNGCSDDHSQTVYVHERPIASFATADLCLGDSALFTDQSTASISDPILDYSWNLGDGNSDSGTIVTHWYAGGGLYDVMLTVSTANCQDDTLVQVNVDTPPSIDFSTDLDMGCSPLTVNFSDASIGATVYAWDFGDGMSSADNSPQHTFLNSGPNDTTFRVLLTASNAFGCGALDSAFITVYAETQASFTSNATPGCAPYVADFNNTSTGASGYQWDFGDGSPTTTDEHPTHLFENNTEFIQYYTVTLVAYNLNGCHDTITHDVISYPEPDFSFDISSASGCAPLQVDFPAVSGAVSYDWDFGDGTSGTGATPTHVYANASQTNMNYGVRLIASNAFGCIDTAYSAVDVYAIPTAEFIASPIEGCSPLTIDFEDLSTISVQNQWIFIPGDTLTTIPGNQQLTYVNSGLSSNSYQVELIVNSAEGCTHSSDELVTIFPEVHAGFTSIVEGCSPLDVSFINTTTGATSYQWNFGDGGMSVAEDPQHTFVNSSSNSQVYDIQLLALNSFGCSDTVSVQITVHPQPTAQFVASPTTGCSPLTVEFSDFSVLSDSYTWIYGTGDTSYIDATTHEYIYLNVSQTPQSYTATLEVESVHGCESSFSQVISTYPEVEATFSMNDNGCAPLEVVFENNTVGANEFYWNYGDGLVGIESQPTHVFNNTGLSTENYYVELTATSPYGCIGSYRDTVTVYPQPIADFTLSEVQGCSPLDVYITDQSSIADSYTWTYGNGETDNTGLGNHDYTYVSQSTEVEDFTLELFVETVHGCTDMQTETLSVFPAVHADFETEESLCSAEVFTFFNHSQGAMNYQWEFGDGASSISANPLHSYSNQSGVDVLYEVFLTATSQHGCADQHLDSVMIFSAPIADIRIDSSSVCYPLYIDFANNSQYATEYNWDYGDGSSSMNAELIHSHVFTNSTTSLVSYEIEMIAYTDQGCSDTAYQVVEVIPPLEADFEAIENGCHPLEVEFSNESSGALSYDWLLEEDVASAETSPIHTFYNYGIEDETFEVMLIASSYFGCADTLTQEITVFPLPDAEFGVDPVLQVYPESTIEIFDYSVSGESANYAWDLGDGTLSDNPELGGHTYDTWGTYDVVLTIDNGHCSDQSTQVVEILAPPPIADFDGGGEGCAPVTIAFDNLSEFGTNYLWNFGDGGISSNENPVYTFYIPGTYTVSLLVTGPGGSEIAVHDTVIHVYPNATAYFTANPEIINTGDNIFFYNLSNQASDFLWDFGDGSTSTESDPIHIYTETGNYPVQLIANNTYNCPDTFLLDDAVFVDVGGYIKFPNAFTPDPLGSTGGYYDDTRLDNDVFFPLYAGVEDYQLQIYNRWGELLYESNEVTRGWDGFYKGKLAQQGVYVWRAKVTFTDGKQQVKAGDLTLLR